MCHMPIYTHRLSDSRHRAAISPTTPPPCSAPDDLMFRSLSLRSLATEPDGDTTAVGHVGGHNEPGAIPVAGANDDDAVSVTDDDQSGPGQLVLSRPECGAPPPGARRGRPVDREWLRNHIRRTFFLCGLTGASKAQARRTLDVSAGPGGFEAIKDRRRTYDRHIRRAAWSYHCAQRGAIERHLTNAGHVVLASSFDDASHKLSVGNKSGLGTSVVTSFETYQRVRIRYHDGSSRAFSIMTPMTFLADGRASTIHLGMQTSLLYTAVGPGRLLRPPARSSDCWLAIVHTADSLAANFAAFAREEHILVQGNSGGGGAVDSGVAGPMPSASSASASSASASSAANDNKTILMHVACMHHQLALARRPLTMAVPTVATTLVRLAHLLEVYRWRTSLVDNMLAVVRRTFRYVPLPPGTPPRQATTHGKRTCSAGWA